MRTPNAGKAKSQSAKRVAGGPAGAAGAARAALAAAPAEALDLKTCLLLGQGHRDDARASRMSGMFGCCRVCVALSEGSSGVSAAIVSGGGAWCVWVYKT